MADFPHRYGDGRRALEHWATACRASAVVLRREGLPDDARALDEAAHGATRPGATTLTEQPRRESPSGWAR
ncbi:hypothetical protein [Phycicoccus sp. DTK01]|uniref:hypothetical protein n=1 Tax=Phycicoccus sp. DTK01 TaxID=2785745 RepID=UPI001A905AB6|nr:hypothetical protein [Phycicoccus sp. DTK01]